MSETYSQLLGIKLHLLPSVCRSCCLPSMSMQQAMVDEVVSCSVLVFRALPRSAIITWTLRFSGNRKSQKSDVEPRLRQQPHGVGGGKRSTKTTWGKTVGAIPQEEPKKRRCRKPYRRSAFLFPSCLEDREYAETKAVWARGEVRVTSKCSSESRCTAANG